MVNSLFSHNNIGTHTNLSAKLLVLCPSWQNRRPNSAHSFLKCPMLYQVWENLFAEHYFNVILRQLLELFLLIMKNRIKNIISLSSGELMHSSFYV